MGVNGHKEVQNNSYHSTQTTKTHPTALLHNQQPALLTTVVHGLMRFVLHMNITISPKQVFSVYTSDEGVSNV